MPLAKQNPIRWKKSDYLTLGKAVAQFNRKINKLNGEEQKLYLPELKSYQEIKENILTRNELNRVINSLKRFSRKGAEELYTTEAGQQITKWERRELGIQSGIAKRRLKQELAELNLPIHGEKFSRAEMGSQRVHQIEDQLRNLEMIETKVGYDFKRLQLRIKKIGTSDYTLEKAYTYQENFMEELQDLAKNMPEFQKVFEYFSKIDNPITFFNTAQKSNALQDFFLWYKNPENYAGFTTTQELADYIIERYI